MDFSQRHPHAFACDMQNQETVSVVERAIANPEAFVLKPQREGGGNNLYGRFRIGCLDRETQLALKCVLSQPGGCLK